MEVQVLNNGPLSTVGTWSSVKDGSKIIYPRIGERSAYLLLMKMGSSGSVLAKTVIARTFAFPTQSDAEH